MRPVAARPLSPPPVGLVLASPSTPWRTVGRMVGLVVFSTSSPPLSPSFSWGCSTATSTCSLVPRNPWMSLTGALCSLPLVAFVLFLRRPRLTHVILAEAASGDSTRTSCPAKRCCRPRGRRCSGITSFGALRPLTFPDPARWPRSSLVRWASWCSCWCRWGLAGRGCSDHPVLGAAHPCVVDRVLHPGVHLVGRVLEVLQLQTDRRQGEAMLIAGMLSTFPALVINSLLFPMGLAAIGITGLAMTEALTVTVSAPVGEEICKFLAVLSLRGMIDSSRRGLQVGFTVGLGFAMLENLQYVLLSLVAEPTTAPSAMGSPP